MMQSGAIKTKRTGCTRTQMLLVALLFPAILVFVYFIHHTHLTHPQLTDPSSDIHAVLALNGQSAGIHEVKKPKVDKVEQLQKFKKKDNIGISLVHEQNHKRKHGEGESYKNHKPKTKEEKQKATKGDDDTPIATHKSGKDVGKKIAPHLLHAAEETSEDISYSEFDGDGDDEEEGDDDADDGNADKKMDDDVPPEKSNAKSDNKPAPEADPVYGEIDNPESKSVQEVGDAGTAQEDGDDDEEEAEAKQAVYYVGDDDDEEQGEGKSKKSPSLSSPLSSDHSEVKVVNPVSTPPPTKKVYIPGYKDKQKQQKLRQHATNKLYNYQPEWGYNGEFKHIQVLPTLKIPLKKDRRVVFPNLTISKPSRDPLELPSGVLGESRELRKANNVLKTHPIYGKPEWYDGSHSIEEVMSYIQQSPYCYLQKPIFLSMATVHDDLYWQLIENFVYTMVKFNTSQCSLVICVSDPNCMKMCGSSYFPCYNYMEANKPLPSVMEQIAKVKLYYVPKALNMGVDVFMLDLDVGFLNDPNVMIQAFYETPIVDIMVQEDYIFIMNRTKAGWKSWFTEPLPNIGLFLCRGNNKTAKVFDIAWQKYLVMDDPWEKAQPGKDQNHVLDAMRIGRGEFGLKYAYFSNYTAPLLDKLVLNYGNVMELGGELMESFLMEHQSLAMHTTCYEKSTKVMGLKAANSFWNPKYYDSLRRTITKQILFKNEGQLLDEVRSMVWLAMVTERSFILPNILGSETIHTIDQYKGQSMWPGFRVTFLKRSKGKNELKVQILEPNFYWRVNRDYDEIPAPTIVNFDPDTESLMDIKEKLDTMKDTPRIVLHPMPSSRRSHSSTEDQQQLQVALQAWANDSVGLFHQPYSQLVKTYRAIPSVKGIRSSGSPFIDEILQGMRNCANIFGPHKGNRTCFQVCD